MVSDLLEPGAEQFARPVLRGLGGSDTPWLPGGYVCIAVDPAYTSQDCSGPDCGNRKDDLTRADRMYHCAVCGLVIGRDLNGLLNSLARGRACVASA